MKQKITAYSHLTPTNTPIVQILVNDLVAIGYLLDHKQDMVVIASLYDYMNGKWDQAKLYKSVKKVVTIKDQADVPERKR